MVQSLLPVLSTLASASGPAAAAISGQNRREISRPVYQSALPAVAAAPDAKRARRLEKLARDEMLYNFFTQPEIIGLVMTVGGIYACQQIKFSDDPVTNELIQATATTASTLIGLGHAGVGDLTTTVVAASAGAGSILGAYVDEIGERAGKLAGKVGDTSSSILKGFLMPGETLAKMFSWLNPFN